MNALNVDIPKGTRVLVKAECMIDKNQSEAARTFVCESGFGMKSFTSGSAIFGYWEADKEHSRIEGYTIEKIVPANECACLEYIGDNPECKQHGHLYRDHTDNSLKAQLDEAGFGSFGPM